MMIFQMRSCEIYRYRYRWTPWVWWWECGIAYSSYDSFIFRVATLYKEMWYVSFCMDCGVFSKAPLGLVGSPCNALILLPHSLPTQPTTQPWHPIHWHAIQRGNCYSRPRAETSRLYLTSVSRLLPGWQHLWASLSQSDYWWVKRS